MRDRKCVWRNLQALWHPAEVVPVNTWSQWADGQGNTGYAKPLFTAQTNLHCWSSSHYCQNFWLGHQTGRQTIFCRSPLHVPMTVALRSARRQWMPFWPFFIQTESPFPKKVSQIFSRGFISTWRIFFRGALTFAIVGPWDEWWRSEGFSRKTPS